MFILAHAGGEGRCPWGYQRSGEGRGEGRQARDAIAAGGAWWADEPRVARVAYGVPGRVDRARTLGNAVVPQVAEHIGRLVTEAS
jgi:DNA (cytosine-5)-methyltransferase 1